jgi:hypothetical protein
MSIVSRSNLSRRHLLQGGAALTGLLLGTAANATPAGLGTMTIYRDPGCGCCGNWAQLARQAGYAVQVVDTADMPSLKRRLGVPRQLEASHCGRGGLRDRGARTL